MDNELLKLDNQLCFRLYNVSKKMTRAYAPFLDQFNLTYPQYIIMLVMFEHKEIDFKELSEIVDLRTGTLTPILQKLETIGYIKRIKNIDDKRKMNVVLTKDGEQLNKDIIAVPLGLSEELKVPLSMYQNLVKEIDDLTKLLNEVNHDK